MRVSDRCHPRPELTKSAEGKGIQRNNDVAKRRLTALYAQHSWVSFPSARSLSLGRPKAGPEGAPAGDDSA